ncbi:MAG TPA: caspase family protein [Gemmataceae bacterium]|nr:caspase family protein [Gemmataceae bacterium]
MKPGSLLCTTPLRLLLTLSLGLLALPALSAAPPAAGSGKKVALVVGINKYHHADLNQPRPLEFAEADAEDLAALLQTAGYQVTVLQGDKATRKAISEALEKLRAVPGSDGVFLVALAGHGLRPEGSKEAYFFPHDAKQRLPRPAEKDKQPWDTDSLLPLSAVIGHLRASSAGSRLLLVDACRNDPASGRGRGVGTDLKVGDLPKNTAVFLSCSEGQRSYEDKAWDGGHGAFFFQVMEGMKGKGADRRGDVTVERLSKHLRKAVPVEVARVIKGGAEQKPFCLVVGDVSPGISSSALAALNFDPSGGARIAHFGPDGIKVVLLEEDEKNKLYYARIYDAATGKALTQQLKHADSLYRPSFSPDGRRLATAGFDGKARIWDVETSKLISDGLKHNESVFQALFSPDSRRVVTTSSDKTARVWDAETGKPLTPFLEHKGFVTSAAFSPDGDRVVTASEDKTACIWDVGRDKPLALTLRHDGAVRHAAFSVDGRLVVTAGDDKTARVWDAQTGKELVRLDKHAGPVWHAAFSRDGRRIVTASQDKTAIVWDARTGEALTRPLPCDDQVSRAWFSPDGRRVVVGWVQVDQGDRCLIAPRGAMGVWDVETGKPLIQPIKTGSLYDASVNAGRRWLVTFGHNSTQVWDLQTGTKVHEVTLKRD